jgi:predicted MFS family arabinose efflux permease
VFRPAPKRFAPILGWVPRASYFAVLAGAVCCYAALGAVLRLLPALVDDRAALGLLVGAPALSAVLARPAGGRLADRAGPARVMLAGAVAMAAGVAPALASASTAALLVSRLLVGAGEGAMMAAAVLWLLRLAGPARRGQALGHIGLANYAGLTAGPLLADALGLDREAVLAGAAALPLAGAALAARARRPPAEAPEAAHGGVLREVLVPGIALMLVNVGYVAFLAFGPAAAGTALVVPLFAAGVIVVRIAGASVPDRLGGARTVRIAGALAAAGLATAALSGGATAVALAGTAVLALGQGLAVPGLGLLALAGVPAARHGAAAGLFFAFFDAGVGAGGPLAGGMARLTTPAGALLLAAGALVAAALVPGRVGR